MTLLTIAMALGGCGKDAANGADLAVALVDMAVSADLSKAPSGPDFAFGTNSDGAIACAPSGGGTRAQYVWNAVTLPMARTDYAWDLNGDGKLDNQLGNIDGALSSQGLTPQNSVDQSIASGQSINLLDEISTDATFTSDGCASSSTFAGQVQSPPDFSGHGHFSVDTTYPPGRFSGPIVAAAFTSEPPPANARVPSVAHVAGPILFGASVDVVGARLTYTRNANGAVTGGQLNGAVRKHDIDTKVIPQVAAQLNAQVQANPTSSTSMQLLSIFDNGGTPSPACGGNACQNLDGSCAKAHDGNIDECEVATNNIIKNVLAPDVQMFDAAGNYAPNPANTNKDSLSIGFAFTAVPCTFGE